MSFKFTWNPKAVEEAPLTIPCPHENCTGEITASLKDFEQKKLVRCSRGHQVQLEPKK